MPLITSKTSLNKIKWGNDRYDNGNSGQPYIKRDIPGVNVNDPNPTLFNDGGDLPAKTGIDFLLRDGFMAPVEAARDVSRLTQMMFDTKSPNGFEFIAKQNLLSRTAVKTEASYGIGYGGVSQPDFIKGTGGGAVNAGIYTPLSTFAQAAVGFTGTHLNLLGLDPSDPMANVGDGGGLFPGAGLTTYTAAMNKNNNFADYSTKEQSFEKYVYNSPVIPNTLILGSEQPSEPEFIIKTVTKTVSTSEDGFNNRLVELYNKKIEITFDKPELIEYTGGPGSILGIGSTTINFADQRTGINNATATNDPSYFLGGDYGKDRYLITSPSIYKNFQTKLNATFQAKMAFPNEKESLEGFTDDATLQNINAQPSTIDSAYLTNIGFNNPDGPNFFNVFKNFGESQTSSSINYETNLTQVLQSSQASASISDETLEELTDVNAIQNNNTPQSTFKNYKLEEANFFDPDGPNNFDVFKNFGEAQSSSSISYENGLTKILQSSQASSSISDAELAELTDISNIQNNNTPQSTFKNYKLEEANFFNPTSKYNNFNVFKNFGDTDSQGIQFLDEEDKINKFILGASNAFSIDPGAANFETGQEVGEANDISQIEANNTPQSTFKNFKLQEKGFFNPDGPNFYNVFLPQSNLPVKENIFVEGSSVSYAYINAFPGAEGNMFDQFSPSGGGGFRLYNNNVYDSNLKTDPTGPAYYNQTQTMTQAQLDGQTARQGIRDFRVPIIESEGITESSVLSLAPSYALKNATNRINRGDPGRVNTKNNTKNVFDYGIPATEGYALDKLTAMPMYDGQGPNTSLAINDFVKFRIAAINNEPDANGSAVYMHFRAFIDGFSDSYNASWDPVKYSGRGEDLYNYTGFNRSINMSFTCFAQSKPELIPMYKKLNYLASTLAPDYTNAGYMRGNLVRLTMGGYLYEQPGFITSLTYDIPQETPWEIAINAAGGQDTSVKELPHMIKVSSLTFTPIQNFLPQKPNDARNPNERYIALSNNSGHGSYNDTYQMQLATGDGDDNNQNNILGE